MSPLQPWGTRERFISLRFRYQLTVNRAEKYCRQYPGGDDMICSQNCIVPSTPGIWIWLALPNFADFIFTFLARKFPSLLQLEVGLGSVVYYTELKNKFQHWEFITVIGLAWSDIKPGLGQRDQNFVDVINFLWRTYRLSNSDKVVSTFDLLLNYLDQKGNLDGCNHFV